MSGWETVIVGENGSEKRLPLQLEEQFLQVQSDSVLGSQQSIRIKLESSDPSSDRNNAGNIWIHYNHKMQYHVGYCSEETYSDFNITPILTPTTTWTIKEIRSEQLLVWCNKQLVLTYTIQNTQTKGECTTMYHRDVAKFFFKSDDNASKLYRVIPTHDYGLNLTN